MLYKKDNWIGAFSLFILIFQGFGLRIFDGTFNGAIGIWLIVLLLINKSYLTRVPVSYWLSSIAVALFYVIFNVVKGATVQSWVVVALLSACVALCRYFNNVSSFILDLRKLAKFCMYYDLLHIPIMLFLNQYIISTDLGMEPKTFLYLFWFNNMVSDFGLNRIQGFCWEPSCWNLLLNINLLLALYFKESKLYIVASIIAVMSTFSTTGMVTMVIIIALYYLINLEKGKLIRTMVTGGLMLAVIGPFVYEEFSSKMESGSGQTRGGDLAIAFVVMKENPIMGEDIDHITELSYAMNARSEYWTSQGDYEGYMNQGFVNSFAGLMVEWGLPIFLCIILLAFRTNMFEDKKVRFMFITTLFLVLMGTPIARTGFFYMFPLSALLIKRNLQQIAE